MKINEIGGEFALIKRLLTRSGQGGAILLPNGDDAAVVAATSGPLVATVDTIVEGKHFGLGYFTPEQVGRRAVEGAASDIAAVGGVPLYLLIALVLPEDVAVEAVDGIFDGISFSASRIGARLIGGDTSSGAGKLSISVTVLGVIPKEGRFVSRAGARPGDLLMVTGGLGGSAAGLCLIKSSTAGFDAVKRYHTEPRCRNELGTIVGASAHAAIDISDGFSSEVHHLSAASGCGVIIDAAKIPEKDGIAEVAKALGVTTEEWILNGGEEYELLLAVPKESASSVPGVVIGEFSATKEVLIRRAGKTEPLIARGFVHLSGKE